VTKKRRILRDDNHVLPVLSFCFLLQALAFLGNGSFARPCLHLHSLNAPFMVPGVLCVHIKHSPAICHELSSLFLAALLLSHLHK
jgi:hypothetical protein